MDNKELKEDINKNTTEEELNIQSTENDNAEEKNLESEKQEVEKLTPEEELEILRDKLARTFAEMENQRRRFEKEKEDAFEYGGFSFAREALSLIDNFERSKIILEGDEKLKDTDALKKTLEHFDIIHKDLMSIFKKNDIKQIDSLNKKLDPNFHQAMMEIEDDSKEPGTIIQEIQKGFTIKDRLLRPSLVGVAKKTQEKTTKTQEIKENSETK